MRASNQTIEEYRTSRALVSFCTLSTLSALSALRALSALSTDYSLLDDPTLNNRRNAIPHLSSLGASGTNSACTARSSSCTRCSSAALCT